MFDLKPDAPAEIRGEFQPIATSRARPADLRAPAATSPGWMHKACLIRTFTHTLQLARSAAVHDRLHRQRLPRRRPSRPTRPTSAPSASTWAWARRDMPGAVCLPCYPGWGESVAAARPLRRLSRQPVRPAVRAAASRRFDREPKVNYYDPVMPVGEPLLPSLDSAAGDDASIASTAGRSLLRAARRRVRPGAAIAGAWTGWTSSSSGPSPC